MMDDFMAWMWERCPACSCLLNNAPECMGGCAHAAGGECAHAAGLVDRDDPEC